MRLNQLEYFVAIDKYGSFSKAAEALYIAQPSISRAIKDLETELGFQLIKRTGTHILLTEEGKLVLEKAKAMLQLKNDIASIKTNLSLPASHVITIGTSSTHCNMIITNSANKLKEQNLSLQLNILQEDFFSLLDLLHTQKIRFALSCVDPIRIASFQTDCLKHQISFNVLYSDTLCFVVGHNHPLASRESVKIEELFEYQFISASKKTSELRFLQNHGYTQNIISINNYWNFQQYIYENPVFSLAPRLSILETNATVTPDKQQKILNVQNFTLPCQFGFLKKENISLTAAESQLCMSIEAYFQTFYKK